MNSTVKCDSSVTGKIYVSDVNGYCICKDTDSITSNLELVSSSAEGNIALLTRNDYCTNVLDIDSRIETGISLDEHIKNVCIKLVGDTDTYKKKNDTEDVTIPPMKGFIEI